MRQAEQMASAAELTTPEADHTPSPLQQADALFGHVYDRLKTMARRQLHRSPGQTLNTTALVHELYVKVCAGKDPLFRDRAQFFVYCAQAMRHILIDRARRRLSPKFNNGDLPAPLSDPAAGRVGVDPRQSLQLEAALTALESEDARAARVVELHHFAGLSLENVAKVLGVVRRTVDRDWRYARAFLASHMA